MKPYKSEKTKIEVIENCANLEKRGESWWCTIWVPQLR